ncbi:ubiquitin-conjugating enzyme/RWD-like protein [Artemisia annua]|uniref:Ubiquitin-conjugating enzyme/RWD-like protein n=1 Tax=Artemisia annua TaxID=35608 RepID=A0A2U1MT24_ARTAN|nr:ubiquitin-conjugating enzyme/RWD-like protein [Artemisia annua]
MYVTQSYVDTRKDVIHASYQDHDHRPGHVVAPMDGQVAEVLVKDGMRVKKGQPMVVVETMEYEVQNKATLETTEYEKERTKAKVTCTKTISDTTTKLYKNLLDEYRDLRKGIFSMENALEDQDDVQDCPMAKLGNEVVLERYKSFKMFDIVMDHSDHPFSAHTKLTKEANPPDDWAEKIKKEWNNLEQHLPEGMFVRAYKERIELLRVLIVGQEGTPYHHGLFFFDVCFPKNYPISPPLVFYNSRGLCINPNLSRSGRVRLVLPKKGGGCLDEENIWVPGSSTLLQFLIFMQNLFNKEPIFYNVLYTIRSSESEDYVSLLYNENTLVKSLKTMVYIMNKPPKNFEYFVVGHFRNHMRDILMAHKAYMDGLRVGCPVNSLQEEGNKGSCSITFKNDLASCFDPLVAAFRKIGSTMEAQELLSPSLT